MSTLSFIRQLAVFCCCVVLLNLVVAFLARNSIPRQVLRRAAMTPPAADIFLGNSLISDGINEAVIKSIARSAVPVNLGLHSTTAVEHLLLFRASTARHHAGRVFYGFFNDQLTRVDSFYDDRLVVNRAFAYFTEPGFAVNLYGIKNPWIRMQFRAMRFFPMVMERLQVWAKVERLRRQIGSIGFTSEADNQYGRASDFSRLGPKSVNDFARDRAADVLNEANVSPAIYELFRSTKQQGATTTLILMPMPTAHRRDFYQSSDWLAYYDRLGKLVNKSGVQIIDASDWVADDGFKDSIHLSPKGAEIFSARLARGYL